LKGALHVAGLLPQHDFVAAPKDLHLFAVKAKLLGQTYGLPLGPKAASRLWRLYVASVPALAGCVSQGGSRAEALANIREAIELYVEDCRDAGDPVPTEVGKEFVEVEAA
jgi:predicted RNase H-like HicB family nuclease